MLPAPITTIVLICSAIVTFSSAITVLVSGIKTLKKPEVTQNQRISSLETKMDIFEKRFYADNVRIMTIERGNKVTQEALLALLEFNIDHDNPDNLEQLKSAKKQLHTYLIDRSFDDDPMMNGHG